VDTSTHLGATLLQISRAIVHINLPARSDRFHSMRLHMHCANPARMHGLNLLLYPTPDRIKALVEDHYLHEHFVIEEPVSRSPSTNFLPNFMTRHFYISTAHGGMHNTSSKDKFLFTFLSITMTLALPS
jgi:hypothetical protein